MNDDGIEFELGETSFAIYKRPVEKGIYMWLFIENQLFVKKSEIGLGDSFFSCVYIIESP